MEPPLSAPAGPALPAWKRAILERKRAKPAGPPAGGEPEPGGGGRADPAPREERLVLADSLGPLRENPFMRLESERRRRRRQGLPGGGRQGAGRPLQELLELYSAVPGIRTIRADNILIIESQPDAAACFAAGDPPAASPRGRDPLRGLLAPQGSAFAEIRAAQVFVYEPPEPGEAGRVSRLLQKFDQQPRGRRRRSRDADPDPLAAVPSSPVSPPARPARVPGSPVNSAAPHRVPGPVASPPNRRVPGSPVSPATAQPVSVPPASPPNQRVPGSPVSAATLRPVSVPRTSPPSPRVPGSPVSPRPVSGPPASPPSPRVPGSLVSPRPVSDPLASPPSPRVPGSLVSPCPVSGPPASPPSPWVPGSLVSPCPVSGPRASPPSQRVPDSPVSAVAPQPVLGSLGTTQAYGFLHKIGSNSFTVTPRGLRPGSHAPLPNGPLEHGASPAGRSPHAKAPPVPLPSVSLARDNIRPKPEGSEEIQPSQSSATPSPFHPLSASVFKDGGSFEIRPAPKPDLAAIPAHDLQAQALANLRLNSRNSFLFVPRRGGGQRLIEPAGALSPLKPECEQQGKPITPPQAHQELLVPVTYIDDDIVELDAGGLPQEMGPAAGLKDLEQPQEATSALGMEASAIPLYRSHPVSSSIHQRGGNTFTIVPKRKPPNSEVEVNSRAQQSEEEDDESRSKGKTLGNPGAPQLDLGPLLKKRYPTVSEIEVIGGYLSLERSCMSKMDSHRKKMKISFNETSLQTTFEYPSESSLVEEEEEEEESASDVEEDEEDKPSPLFIPRPTCTMHANVPSSGFSSYTPKHSVEFSKWQEQEYEEEAATAPGPPPKEADPPGSQVMLTPADQSGLSDFSSEPALYF